MHSKENSHQPTQPPITLTIDVGGQGIKGRKYTTPSTPVSERLRIRTPRPATPKAVLDTIAELVEQLHPFDRVAVGFPGVVRDGLVINAPNLDGRWHKIPLAKQVAKVALTPVKVINDADLQGYGAIEGTGLEMVITLGTGMGAALFIDGHLLPNLELGHHPFEKGESYEERLGQFALQSAGKPKWNRRLKRALRLMKKTFNFDKMYVGGGNARYIKFDLPAGIEKVPNAIAFPGGVKLWSQS